MTDRLDPRAIAELRELMGDDFDSLIDAFCSDSEAQIVAIGAAAAHNDAERVRRVAHGLKGASVNLGVGRLAELCGCIEELGRSGNCAGVDATLRAARAEFDAVCAALEAIKQPQR
jgi:HPt (histidine-containing phosphotransfer) domain-containing protein